MRLITEWSTDDVDLAKTLKLIADLPTHDPVRHELEAALHMQQARFAWREADRLRELERDGAARRARDSLRGPSRYDTCPSCGVSVCVRYSDGCLRRHSPGIGSVRAGAVCPGTGVKP